MANHTTPNCTSLIVKTSFPAYVQTLRNQTGNDLSLAPSCKTEICSALWGTGNPDISGIGMITGYILQLLLSTTITLFLLLRPTKTLLNHIHDTYTDVSLFFTASVQVATLVVLIRHDYGISTSGLGGLTVEVTWSVALVTMLSTMLPVFVPAPQRTRREDKARQGLRFAIFWCCWLAFFYSFVSRMLQSPQTNRSGKGTTDNALTDAEWEVIQEMCFAGGANAVAWRQQMAISAFGVAGSMVVSLFAVGRLGWEILGKEAHERAARVRRNGVFKRIFGGKGRGERSVVLPVVLLVAVPVLGIPLIWAIFNIRGVERALAKNTGNQYVDNEWTFGQVVAVFLFMPVFVEAGFLWRQNRADGGRH